MKNSLKSRLRQPLWNIAALAVLAAVNPYLYSSDSSFAIHGLEKLGMWANTFLGSLLLAVLMTAVPFLCSAFFSWLFSRRRITANDWRDAVAIACNIAVLIELALLAGLWVMWLSGGMVDA